MCGICGDFQPDNRERSRLGHEQDKAKTVAFGHTSTLEAGALGMGTGIAGVSMLSILPNPDVASLSLMNIVLYAGVYTYSKPSLL